MPAAIDAVVCANWCVLALQSNRAIGERPGESGPGAHFDAGEDRQAWIVNGGQSPSSQACHPKRAGSRPADAGGELGSCRSPGSLCRLLFRYLSSSISHQEMKIYMCF